MRFPKHPDSGRLADPQILTLESVNPKTTAQSHCNPHCAMLIRAMHWLEGLPREPSNKGGRNTAISQQVRLIQKLVDKLEEGDAEVDQRYEDYIKKLVDFFSQRD